MRVSMLPLAAVLFCCAVPPALASQAARPQDYGRSAVPERREAPERAEAPEQGDDPRDAGRNPGQDPGQDPARDLVRQLNLRPDQQAAFRAYQAAFQQPDESGDGDDPSRLAAMTTPQRLDESARQMDRDRADFERVAAATRRLYATLDPQQRRTFDRLTAPQPDDDDPDGDARDPSSAPSGR